jgi:hypothetical protein
MRLALIGGGYVAQTLGAALIAKGHDLRLGLREVTTEALAKPRANAATLAEWQERTGAPVVAASEAAAWGEVAVNATPGHATLDALRPLADGLGGKVLIDMSNPLDFSAGMPPFLLSTYSGPTSLGEQVQAALPGAQVVKAFNTVNTGLLVNPGLVPGEHDLFVAGDDAEAKGVTVALARELGWSRFNDMGGIRGARAMEALLVLWGGLFVATGSPLVNLRVARAA